MAKMRRRTKARELTLQFLYMYDISGQTPDDKALASFLSWQSVTDSGIREFTEGLVWGVYDNRSDIRERILPLIKNWTEDRLTVIDRNILRMAAYELSYMDDVPFKVTINEAIDLGKKYSTKESGKFVNGILDEYARRYVPSKG